MLTDDTATLDTSFLMQAIQERSAPELGAVTKVFAHVSMHACFRMASKRSFWQGPEQCSLFIMSAILYFFPSKPKPSKKWQILKGHLNRP